MPTVVRERIEVTGIVQGVGFRPFVHRMATDLGLDGHVGNDSSRVFIELAGESADIDRFVRLLSEQAPPLARIEQITRASTEHVPRPGFRIIESRAAKGARTPVPPDTAVCVDCRRELADPTDRRFGHPFITCTNCGPRFTIISSTPYDRPNTTMADFVMCHACEAEYRDPNDRRYHAQPIACHDCGPRLSVRYGRHVLHTSDPIAATTALLSTGAVVAIKGLGGYHLACDATNDEVIATLRARKQRADKPFAVMVADLEQARELATITTAEAALLRSPSAPIVLLRRRSDSQLSALVAPGSPLVGVMMAYTPVHHLLFRQARTPLVMTSANRRGEPIAFRTETLGELIDLYDARLDHDRPIHIPCDDSVVRMVGDRLLPSRRARGYAPIPIAFGDGKRSVLAVGGELKNTFCVVANNHAWVSQHIGDMENLATLDVFGSAVAQFLEMYEVEPDVVAADAHPDYLSSKWARAGTNDRIIEIQHHHAHIAAVMAEHQLEPNDSVIGFAFDGTGYGDDGTIWGGELLIANVNGYERVAGLAPISLPGGDAAIRNPCRVALAHLHAAGIAWSARHASFAQLSGIERELLSTQLESGFACVATTSMGRLFDAVASLLGIRHEISYEAQAAIELEIAAAGCTDETNGYRFAVADGSADPGPVLRSLLDDRAMATSVEIMAWRFHDAVAEVVHRLAVQQRTNTGLNTVVLAGGVFQNALLTQLCVDRLRESSFVALIPSLVPPNDGGLALGQAYIAAHRTDPVVQGES